MPYHAQREPDLEGNQGGHASREIYNVNDPSWTIDHSRHNIITKISKPVGSWFNVQENSDSDEHSYRIDFAELQRIRLRQIQHKLVQHAISIRYDAREPPGWAEDLRQYVEALRDYDYISKPKSGVIDPFIETGERFIDRLVLQGAMRDKEDERDPLPWDKPLFKWETGNQLNKQRKLRNLLVTLSDKRFRRAWIRAFRKRFCVATAGGIFLIVPMWLMVLHRTLYTALISTTIFVTIFGLIMALFLDRSKDVLSSTAAYSAVLVVFVGLTVPNTTP